jgi:ribose transport system substrate-binding protein
VVALFATACAGPAPKGDGAGEPARPRVALIMKSLANEFFVTMSDGATRHAEQNADRYELLQAGIKDESDLARQVALVEQMMANRVDAIVIAPADSKALVPALRKAAAAGIVVVNIDNRLDPQVVADEGLVIPFVGPDNREGARRVGEALAAKLPAGAEVAILEGIPTAFNSQQRRLGFEDAMRAAGTHLVTVQSAGWEQARASQVAAAILSEHPDVAALLCANDSMALGAAAALRQAGREGEVKIVGFDNISAVRQLLADGRLFATADQHGEQLAVFGIEAALDLLAGSPTGDRRTPVDLITAETLGGTQPPA